MCVRVRVRLLAERPGKGNLVVINYMMECACVRDFRFSIHYTIRGLSDWKPICRLLHDLQIARCHR